MPSALSMCPSLGGSSQLWGMVNSFLLQFVLFARVHLIQPYRPMLFKRFFRRVTDDDGDATILPSHSWLFVFDEAANILAHLLQIRVHVSFDEEIDRPGRMDSA